MRETQPAEPYSVPRLTLCRTSIRGLPLSAKSTTIRPNSGAKIDGDSNAERGIENGSCEAKVWMVYSSRWIVARRASGTPGWPCPTTQEDHCGLYHRLRRLCGALGGIREGLLPEIWLGRAA